MNRSSPKPITSYVASLMEVIEKRNDEIRRVRERGVRAVDPCGPVATEVLAAVRSGSANHERILEALDMDSAALTHYLTALKKAGFVQDFKKRDSGSHVTTRWRAVDIDEDVEVGLEDVEAA